MLTSACGRPSRCRKNSRLYACTGREGSRACACGTRKAAASSNRAVLNQHGWLWCCAAIVPNLFHRQVVGNSSARAVLALPPLAVYLHIVEIHHLRYFAAV